MTDPDPDCKKNVSDSSDSGSATLGRTTFLTPAISACYCDQSVNALLNHWQAVSCGLYALSPGTTVYPKYCSAVYALLDTGRIMEETFFPYAKFEIRELHHSLSSQHTRTHNPCLSALSYFFFSSIGTFVFTPKLRTICLSCKIMSRTVLCSNCCKM